VDCLLVSGVPGLVLATLYVNLPELDIAVVASGGQDSAVWRQGTFTDSLVVHKRKHGFRLLFYTAEIWLHGIWYAMHTYNKECMNI